MGSSSAGARHVHSSVPLGPATAVCAMLVSLCEIIIVCGRCVTEIIVCGRCVTEIITVCGRCVTEITVCCRCVAEIITVCGRCVTV